MYGKPPQMFPSAKHAPEVPAFDLDDCVPKLNEEVDFEPERIVSPLEIIETSHLELK